MVLPGEPRSRNESINRARQRACWAPIPYTTSRSPALSYQQNSSRSGAGNPSCERTVSPKINFEKKIIVAKGIVRM